MYLIVVSMLILHLLQCPRCLYFAVFVDQSRHDGNGARPVSSPKDCMMIKMMTSAFQLEE